MSKTIQQAESQAQVLARRAKKLEEAKKVPKPEDEFVQAQEPTPIAGSN